MQTIELRTFGEITSTILEQLREPLSTRFALPVHIGPPLPLPSHAYDPARRQYLAATLRADLQAARPADAQHILGICDVDIYAPHLNFVFGEASRPEHNAVISLVRLSTANTSLFTHRVITEAVHELGHSYGLSHCPQRRCVMHFSIRLADTDYKSPDFCTDCHEQLLKSPHSSGGEVG